MAYVRYKTFGKKEYAYRVTAKYNPELKRCVQTQEYLGVVIDKEKKIYRKTRKEGKAEAPSINGSKSPEERAVLDYGDTYALETATQGGSMWNTMKKTLGTLFQAVMCLIYY